MGLRAAATATLLFVCACGSTVPRSTEALEQQRVEALSAEVVRMGRLDLPGTECGLAPAAGANVVVFATADLCLSCLEAGALLRDLTRRGLPAPEGVVLTPATHTREVCEYLRREKVRWRVVGLSGERLPAARAPRGIVYFELEPDGRIRRREHAATPLELAAMVLSRPGAVAPAHPRREDVQ
ncbi:hypothetical protein [Longimicrobium sp.]|uniref:hypothetical protein n=1 Tax=Longimicrobium sp. TaxID=2029185 RepID=UPI002E3225DA|nr:hypothetical protein [Longimicrobium sp.]HEX6040488.1 hypothetical protein [Longimicrobium sp.]